MHTVEETHKSEPDTFFKQIWISGGDGCEKKYLWAGGECKKC